MHSMQVDTPTLVVISVLVDAALALALLHAWRTRTTYPGFGQWFAGTICWSVGSALVLLGHNITPLFIPKILGNTLIFLNPLLLYEGFNRFYGIQRRWWRGPLNLSLLLVSVSLLFYFLYVDESLAARTIINNLLCGLLYTRLALEPLFHATARRHSIQWLLSLSLLPLILLLLLRALVFSTELTPPTLHLILAKDDLLRSLVLYGIFIELVLTYSYLSLTSDRLEMGLREARRAVEEANKAKNVFLGMVSHEMRTPLAIITGVCEILSKRLGAKDRDEVLPLLVQSTSVLRRHINDLLDLTKMEAGAVRLETSYFNLRDLRDEILAIFIPRLEAKGLSYLREESDDLPEVIRGDRQRVFQIVSNLFENALKSTTAGTISTRTVVLADQIIFSITDTGCGISPEQLEAVFDPFTSFSPSGGTGLGLPISRRLAEAMGGSLSVESTPEKGSCFTICLPYVEPAEKFVLTAPNPVNTLHLTEPLEVLVVDDLPENLRLIRLLLADTPYVLTIVESGLHALELIRTRRFDVLLTDICMSEMDGITLVRTIRADERKSNARPMRIIGLSANASHEDREAALKAGCDSYLSRPFNTNSLLRAMSLPVAAVPPQKTTEPPKAVQKTAEQERQAVLEREFDLLRIAARDRIGASLAAIEEALGRGDCATIAKEGHRIKGLGMSLGIPDAERVGAGLESAGRSGRREGVAELLQELRAGGKIAYDPNSLKPDS